MKLCINYKKHHTALDAFPEGEVCRDNDDVMSCSSLDMLHQWNKALINKY